MNSLRFPCLAATAALIVTTSVAVAQAPTAPLEPLVLEVLSAQRDDIVGYMAMFNPVEYTIEKSAPWMPDNAGASKPQLSWTSADGLNLSFQSDVEATETQPDVRDVVEPLLAIVPQADERKRPPIVLVNWGNSLQFRGVVERIRVTYTLFAPDGTPLRAGVAVTLKEQVSKDERSRSKPPKPRQ